MNYNANVCASWNDPVKGSFNPAPKGSRPTGWESQLRRLSPLNYCMAHTATTEWAAAELRTTRVQTFLRLQWAKWACAAPLHQPCVYGACAHLETLIQDTLCASRTWITSLNLISKVQILASPYHSKPISPKYIWILLSIILKSGYKLLLCWSKAPQYFHSYTKWA